MNKATAVLIILGAIVTLVIVMAVEQATHEFRALRDGQAAILIEIHDMRR
jgi:hypothetical protein